MDYDQKVLISLSCQRTTNDYDSAKSIDNTLNNFLASEHPDASKRDQYDASTGIYETVMSIPVDTIAEAGQIWGRFDAAIDTFAPFADQPRFTFSAKGII